MHPKTFIEESAEKYSKYYRVEALGGWFGIASCLRCGCAILFEGSNVEKHDAWHLVVEKFINQEIKK